MWQELRTGTAMSARLAPASRPALVQAGRRRGRSERRRLARPLAIASLAGLLTGSGGGDTNHGPFGKLNFNNPHGEWSYRPESGPAHGL